MLSEKKISTPTIKKQNSEKKMNEISEKGQIYPAANVENLDQKDAVLINQIVQSDKKISGGSEIPNNLQNDKSKGNPNLGHPLQNDKAIKQQSNNGQAKIEETEKQPFDIDAYEELAAKYEYEADLTRIEAEKKAYRNFIMRKGDNEKISAVAQARAKEVEKIKALRKPEVSSFWNRILGDGEVREADLIDLLRKVNPSRFPTEQSALNAIFNNEYEHYICQVEKDGYKKTHIWRQEL